MSEKTIVSTGESAQLTIKSSWDELEKNFDKKTYLEKGELELFELESRKLFQEWKKIWLEIELNTLIIKNKMWRLYWDDLENFDETKIVFDDKIKNIEEKIIKLEKDYYRNLLKNCIGYT